MYKLPLVLDTGLNTKNITISLHLNHLSQIKQNKSTFTLVLVAKYTIYSTSSVICITVLNLPVILKSIVKGLFNQLIGEEGDEGDEGAGGG